jgi:hypothetical protein
MQDPPERASTAPRGQTCQNGLHVIGRHLVSDLSLVTGSGQDLLGQDPGEVDEGPRDGRYRYSAAPACIFGVDAAYAVSRDPLHPPLHYGNHLRAWR